MLRSEAGLKWFVELVVIQVSFDLGGDGAFQYFRQKGEIGDGSVVVGDVGVEAGLFEDGCNRGEFEGRRDRTSGQGGVNYREDEWTDYRQTSFD